MIPRILCPQCELKQTPAQQCRRCKAAFYYPAEINMSVVDRPLPTLAQAERELILAWMSRVGGDAAKAARAAGIGKSTMYRKLKDFTAVDLCKLAGKEKG